MVFVVKKKKLCVLCGLFIKKEKTSSVSLNALFLKDYVVVFEYVGFVTDFGQLDV